MKLHIPIILLFLFPVFAQAQFDQNWGYATSAQIDSLRQTLAIEKNDTLRMATYRSLALYYQDNRQDSSLYFAQQQLALAKKINIKIWMADAYTQAGYMNDALGRINEAYASLLASDEIAKDERNENSNWHPWIFSNAQNLHDSRSGVIADNQHAWGNFYHSVDEAEKQKAAYVECVRLGKTIDNGKLISLGYGSLGSAKHNDDSAIALYRQSIQYAEKSGFKKYVGLSLGNIAYRYFLRGQLDSAKRYVLESILPNQQQGVLNTLASTYAGLSYLYAVEKKKDSTLYFANKSIETATLFSNLDAKIFCFTNVAATYNFIGMMDSAYKYENLANRFNDSLKQTKIKQLTAYQKFAFNEQLRLKKLNDDKTAYQNRLKLYAVIAALAVVLIVAFILFRNNRQKQKANQVLETTLTELKSTQQQLIQSEKMASLGELTAGIAHEIQNPLNFVNNFSEVNKELAEELKTELASDSYRNGNQQLVIEITNDIKENSEKINHHGKRADSIVKGMLQHSRSSTGQKEPTDINALADEYLRLAYHGVRAKDNSFNATLKTDFDNSISKINIIPQDIGRVLLNLITNAFYAVSEKATSCKLRAVSYEPDIYISTKKLENRIEIRVEDNGNGIPQNIVDKIFQPFFTTKPTGQGTGLGLSLAYDIVKAHGGEVKVETKDGEGSVFIIQIPN